MKLLPFQSCLMLFLVESTCGWGTQGKALSVAALLNITKAGVVVWSGRDTPQIISKQKNGGVLVCLVWMCTIQLKLYNELCTIAGWNRSSLNSRNFRACGMWALFMSFPSYWNSLFENVESSIISDIRISIENMGFLIRLMKVIYCLLCQTWHAICHIVVCVSF